MPDAQGDIPMIRNRFRAPLAYALLAFAAPGLVGSAAAATTASSDSPQVRNVIVRLNPVPGRPSAGYMTIIGTNKDEVLVSAAAPGARIEMHTTEMAGGVMRMKKLDSIRVDAGMGVHFDPGANHLMIFGLTGAPKTLPITFNFASGAKVTAVADVQAAGAEPIMKMDHANH
jgi:copper(I)-binding protein